MTADDILYAPITPDPTPPIIDQALIAQIALCLGDPTASVSFHVDPKVTLATYLRVAEIIESDPVIFKAVRRFCAYDPLGNFRPANAITAKTLFTSLYADPLNRQMFWTAKGSIHGVITIEFANTFSLVSGMPTVLMSDGTGYEWWMVGLMGNFAGYRGYYGFMNEPDARSFWKATP